MTLWSGLFTFATAALVSGLRLDRSYRMRSPSEHRRTVRLLGLGLCAADGLVAVLLAFVLLASYDPFDAALPHGVRGVLLGASYSALVRVRIPLPGTERGLGVRRLRDGIRSAFVRRIEDAYLKRLREEHEALTADLTSVELGRRVRHRATHSTGLPEAKRARVEEQVVSILTSEQTEEEKRDALAHLLLSLREKNQP